MDDDDDSALKRQEILTYVATLMNFEDLLSKPERKRDIFVIPFI